MKAHDWPVTYSYALPVPGGWVGIVCSDAALTCSLYESATVCADELTAERAASDEFADAVRLVAGLTAGS